MQLQTLFTAVAALAMSVGPALALPNAIPELESRAQCIGGHNLVGSGCGPGQKGKTSCSANDRAVVSTSSYFGRNASRPEFSCAGAAYVLFSRKQTSLRGLFFSLDYLRWQRACLEDTEQMPERFLQQQLRLHIS